MVDEDQCIHIILEKNPKFNEKWNEYLDFWRSEKMRGLCNDLGAFSDYVRDLLQKKEVEDLKEIFDLIEWLLLNGTDEVKDAITTGFLENLLNYCSYGSISPKSFVYLLGSESRKYCKAWDEFTGIKTEGLDDGIAQDPNSGETF